MTTRGQPGWSGGGGSSCLPLYLLVAVMVVLIVIPSSPVSSATTLNSQRKAGVASRSHSFYYHSSDDWNDHSSYHDSYDHSSHYHSSDHWNDGPYDTRGTDRSSVAHRIHQDERERQWLTPFEECGRRFLDHTTTTNNNNASRNEDLVTLCDPSATLTAMERQTIRNLAPDSTTNTTTAPMVVVVILPPERSVHKQNALPHVWFGVDCDRDRCDIGTFTGLLYRFFTTEVKPSSLDLLVVSPTDQQAFIYVHSATVRRTISVNPLHPLPPRSPNDDDDSSSWISLKYSLTTLMQQGEVVRAIQETVQWFLEAQPKESSSSSATTTTNDPNSIVVGQSLEKDKTQNGQPTMSSSTTNHLTAQSAGVHSKEPNTVPNVGLAEVSENEDGQQHLLVNNNGTQSKGQRSVSTDGAGSDHDEQGAQADSQAGDNNREDDDDEASTNPTTSTKNKKNWWWISLGWLAAIAVAVAWCFQCCVVASVGTITCRECHTWCDDTKRWLRMVQNQWDLIHAGRALQGKFKATCCPICLESFQYRSGRGETLPLLSKHKHHQVGRMVGSDGLPLKLLPCGHVFDTTCWEEWACHCERDQLTCPVCRRRVEMFKPQARRNPFTTTSPLDDDSTMSEDHDEDNEDDDSYSGSLAHIVGQILAQQQQQNSQLQRPIRPLPRVPHAPSSRHNIRTSHRTTDGSSINSSGTTNATTSSSAQRLSRAWYAQRLRSSSSDALPQHEGDVPEWPFRPSSSSSSQQRTMGRRQRPSSSSPLLQRSRSSPPRSSPRPRRPQRHVRPSSSGRSRSSTATTLVTSRSDDSQDHLQAYPLSSFSSFWAIQQERIYQTFSDLQEPSSGLPERRRPETLTPQRQDSLLSVTTRWPDYDLEDYQDSLDEDDDDDAEARHRESQRQGLDSV